MSRPFLPGLRGEGELEKSSMIFSRKVSTSARAAISERLCIPEVSDLVSYLGVLVASGRLVSYLGVLVASVRLTKDR